MPNPTFTSFLGIAREATFGTAVPAVAYIPVKSMTPKDNLTLLADKGMRGSMVETYDQISGPIYAEYDFDGDVFADTIGYPLIGVLGDVTVSGTATGSGATTLAAQANAGAVTMSATASIPAGTLLQVGTGVTAEVVTTGTPTGAGPYSIPIATPAGGLLYTHASLQALTPIQAAPLTHGASVLNNGTGQPPSYTVTDYYGINTRQFAGAKFSELGFKFSGDGMLTYSAKATALASAPTTAPTSSYSGVTPVAGWTGAVTIGGAGSLILIDGECTIKRPVSVIHTVDGSQAPYALWSGPVTVSGKMTLVMESDTQLTNYLTNAKPSLDINYAAGSGASATQVKHHLTKCAYTGAQVARGKDYLELSVDYEALANTTDIGASGGYSPIRSTLQNATSAGVYK